MVFEEFQAQLLSPPLRSELVPPPRFDTATFETYTIDPSIEGLKETVHNIQTFVQSSKKSWWPWSQGKHAGLYLDGDFGVGKTHLLAAMFHAKPGTGTFCSFADAISLAIIQGPDQAIETLAADLVCIDEFELDDPSNTRMADLLVDGLVQRGCKIAVTSNTVPGELGEGRMSVDKFKDQLVRIASTFTDVHVPGHDYRQRSRPAPHQNPIHWSTSAEPFTEEDGISLSMTEFDELLTDVPIVNLRRLAMKLQHIHLFDVIPCADQLIALRFVHAIDALYNYRSSLRIRSEINLEDLFLPEYRDWAFAKKYRRCSSRLAELCGDAS